MKTLVVSGSIRSKTKHTDYIFNQVQVVSNLEGYVKLLNEYKASHSAPANSDILSGVVMLAMKEMGAEIDFFSLQKLFPRSEKKITYQNDSLSDPNLALTDTLSLNNEQLEILFDKISSADGIVLVTPVYFGDRSSVANKLLQITGMRGLLGDKVFGTVSVGAKRNGGQETTIIYSLYEALNQNATIVGNGPPTSQYGGTAVGGKRGSVLDDSWGIETSYGTGKRVAYCSKLLKKGTSDELGRPVKVTILVTMDDTQGMLYGFLSSLIENVRKKYPNAKITLKNVLDTTIYRCLGCDKCPSDGPLPLGEKPSIEHHPNCIINNPEDSMVDIHELLLDSDGIIIAGLNVKEHDQLLYRYQVLTERTRYIRRDHFELSNKLLTAFSLNQVGARINSLHSMKTLTSYIRHNVVMHKPIEAYTFNGSLMNDVMEDFLHFIQLAEKLAIGRKNVTPLVTKYTTKGIGGY